ncbi:phosphatidylserine lipase ABHD16A isoform X1 [Ciona intestinalis]
MSIQRLYACVFGPTISRIHRSNDASRRAYNYEPNGFEEKSQKVLNFLLTTKSLLYYTTPIWLIFLYRRGFTINFNLSYCCLETLSGYTKFGVCASAFIVTLLLTRGYGRSTNSDYNEFLTALASTKKNAKNKDKKKEILRYDFDFSHWPYDFRWDEVETVKSWLKRQSLWQRMRSQHDNVVSTVLVGIPEEIIAYIISHTFGVRLAYPGSTMLLQAAYGSALQVNRAKLVEENDGIRGKLLARDGNSIDTMFVDRRGRNHENRYDRDTGVENPTQHGNTIVICCEGNAGFYEVGCMCTPLQAGYSVIGWNHPGFAGSTGMPFPEAEENAVDVVFQYVIHELEFQPENIIVFAWSIGGFSAISAALRYPNIKGLFLDATFYDVLPFAKKMMPELLEPIVTYTVRNYLNLNNSECLQQYKGPVSIVRRTQDEVMNLDGQHNFRSNLGNMLIEEMLKSRFPKLFVDELGGKSDEQTRALWSWLSAVDSFNRDEVLNGWSYNAKQCEQLIRSHLTLNPSCEYPLNIGEDLTSVQKTQLVLYLVTKITRNLPSSHCTPLPHSYFCQPWNIHSVINQSESDSGDSDFELINS